MSVIASDWAYSLVHTHPDVKMTQAVNGLGTVHHVAMAIASADEQLRLRDTSLRHNIQEE